MTSIVLMYFQVVGMIVSQSIRYQRDGIFIHSDQNVAKFNWDGTLAFQAYYPAPREPGWKRALLYAEAVRGAYVGAQAYYVSGAMASIEDDVRQEDAATGEMVNQIGNAYVIFRILNPFVCNRLISF